MSGGSWGRVSRVLRLEVLEALREDERVLRAGLTSPSCPPACGMSPSYTIDCPLNALRTAWIEW